MNSDFYERIGVPHLVPDRMCHIGNTETDRTLLCVRCYGETKMSQYYITHACGHTQHHNIFGKGQAEQAAYLETKPCQECRMAAQSMASASANANAGLPVLVGSGKQVAWAETIRAKAIGSKHNEVQNITPTDEHIAQVSEAYGSPVEELHRRFALVQAAQEKARNELLTTTSAKWWIDNRGDIESHVDTVRRQVYRQEFADLLAMQEASRAQAERDMAAKKQRLQAEHAAKVKADAERLKVAQESETKRVLPLLRSFVVTAVRVDHDNVEVDGADGRMAKGFIDGTDLGIYDVGGEKVDSLHPEAERIAANAYRMWRQSQQPC